jgi:hypothetical protein
MDERVRAYLNGMDESLREDCAILRERLMRGLVHAEEGFDRGFPVYYLQGKPVAGYACRKNGVMIYLMAPDIAARYDARLAGSLDSNICVKRGGKPAPPDVYEAIDEMIVEIRLTYGG